MLSVVLLAAAAAAQPMMWEPVLTTPSIMPGDMCFLADGLHGWMVGSASAGGEVISAIFATDDGGATWSRLPFADSSSAALGGVCFVDANTGWVVGSNGFIRRTTDGGQTWQSQASPISVKLSRVHFTSSNLGWITGGWGTSQYPLLKTTDGGATWQNLSFGSDCYSCEDIWFADSLNGWLVGQNSSINPFIKRTTDGGLTWNDQSAPIPSGNGPVSSVCFPTARHGWAVVSSIYQSPAGTILHTTDGGANWSAQATTGLHYNYALDAPDTLHCAILSTQVLGSAQGRVVWTTNGGANWSNRALPSYSYGYGCQYRGARIWVAQDNSQVYATTDNGATWGWQLHAPMWRSLCWSSPSVGWLVAGSSAGQGYCYRTSDGGNTWTRDTLAPGGVQVQFVSPQRGWMLREGNSARIFRTTDGGGAWAEFGLGTSNWVGRMFFANQDSGWACGSQGTMRVTTDGGATWASQSIGTTNYCEDVFMLNSKEGWCCGGYGSGNGFIRRTTDGGASWQAQQPAQADHLNRIWFIDSRRGWAVAYGGIVQRTTDGGQNWQTVGSVSRTYVDGLLFVDSLLGWLAVGNQAGSSPGEDGRGFIYRTTNGGVMWIEEYRAEWPRGWVNALSWQPTGVLWACGNHATVLRGNPPQALAEGGAARVHVLQLWPQPARNVLRLGGQEPVTLFGADGRTVTALWPGANDIRGLAGGAYFARGRGGVSAKVLIQR